MDHFTLSKQKTCKQISMCVPAMVHHLKDVKLLDIYGSSYKGFYVNSTAQGPICDDIIVVLLINRHQSQ